MSEKKAVYRRNHMPIPWHDIPEEQKNVPVRESRLRDQAALIGRIGMVMLSTGTTAWRVRGAMATAARSLGVLVIAEIGIITINYTCYSGNESFTQALSLETIGVNTCKLHRIERFVSEFADTYADQPLNDVHTVLDQIEKTPEQYSTAALALAAAFACAGFIFNLGGGIAEVICVFIAAGCGNLARKLSGKAKMSAMIGVVSGAVVACVVYACSMLVARALFPDIISFGTGFIGAVLFLVPGFPFITSVLDLAKLDMRSGIERLVYSLIVMAFATIFCWVTAMIFGLSPSVGNGIAMSEGLRICLRLVASFAGVIGFSMIFNSPMKMAVSAGVIGAIANTLRLELVDNTDISAVICSFIGAFLVGIAASLVVKKTGFPRVGITVPAVVVSVPGLFMYRAIYYIGTGDMSQGIMFFLKAAGMVFAIGLGILFSRYITDKHFRHLD